MLVLRDIRAGYGDREVLRGVSLTAKPRELWAVLGPNGAGKSTLLKAALGLTPLSGGEVSIHGASLAGLPRTEVARRVGWVPQADVPLDFTALELALLGCAPRLGAWGLPSQGDVERARKALEEAGVPHLAARPLSEASGGERRLAYLARALVQAPEVLLLDEPTAFLDVRHQVDVLSRVKKRVDAGLCAVAVLHDVNLAAAWATHALLLKAGEVLAQGPAAEVLEEKNLSALFGVEVRRGEAGGQPVFVAQVPP
jgi:iron complex transport system ATP-binding protein